MAIENSNTSAVEDRVQDLQDEIESRVRGLQTGSYARILKMARKPSKEEFRQTVIAVSYTHLTLPTIRMV